MATTVGIIGLGPMGGNIAGILLGKDFPVVGYDIVAANMDRLAGAGLGVTSSATEVAEKADILISSLPSAKALRDVVEKVLEHDQAGQVLIECSTLAVNDKIEAHDQMKQGGKILLDCPISATPAMLAKMMASIHISGDKDAFEKCLPVFEGFTASNFFVGEVGNGSKMKILANYLVHVHVTAAAECMVMGQKAGLDPQLIYDVLKASAGTSKMFEIRGAMMAKSDYREGGGTMFAVLDKDAGIITEFAASVKAPVDLYVISRQRMMSAMATGLGHLDTSAVCKVIETTAGIDRKLVE